MDEIIRCLRCRNGVKRVYGHWETEALKSWCVNEQSHITESDLINPEFDDVESRAYDYITFGGYIDEPKFGTDEDAETVIKMASQIRELLRERAQK